MSLMTLKSGGEKAVTKARGNSNSTYSADSISKAMLQT